MSLNKADDRGFLLRTEITLNWVPSRTLLYSVILHLELVVLLWVGLPWLRFRPSIPLKPADMVPDDEQIVYLPSLEPAGSSGPGASGKAAPAGGSAGSTAAPSAKIGRQAINRGRQSIISNPPNPDNYVQTIRRPDLISPPKLKSPLQLPNLVLLARSAPPSLAPQPKSPIVTATAKPRSLPKLAPEPISAVPAPSLALEPSKLTLPPPTAPDLPKPQPTPEPAQTSETATQAKAAPVPPPPPATVGGGTDDRTVVVLNALHVATQAQVTVPAGELQGAFAVSPGEGGRSWLGDPGAIAEQRGGEGPGGPQGAPGGSGAGGGSGGAGAGTGKGTGTGQGTGGASGNGPGSGGGSGTGAGAGAGGTGPGRGQGTGPGSGGSGTGSGSGLGSGTGPGKGPFPGITIQGGGFDTGRQGGNSSPRTRGPSRQYSYGMTIVASASSGGGLKDFGVFHNEAVYTVYIAMSDSDAPMRDWTMQYALLKPDPAADPPGDSPASAAPLLVPPFALSKTTPHFPPEAAVPNVGRMIVVSAIVSAEGKLENIRTIQSPSPLLTAALLAVLGQWQFRPAEANGAHVAVRVLLGVPITATE